MAEPITTLGAILGGELLGEILQQPDELSDKRKAIESPSGDPDKRMMELEKQFPGVFTAAGIKMLGDKSKSKAKIGTVEPDDIKRAKKLTQEDILTSEFREVPEKPKAKPVNKQSQKLLAGVAEEAAEEGAEKSAGLFGKTLSALKKAPKGKIGAGLAGLGLLYYLFSEEREEEDANPDEMEKELEKFKKELQLPQKRKTQKISGENLDELKEIRKRFSELAEEERTDREGE